MRLASNAALKKYVALANSDPGAKVSMSQVNIEDLVTYEKAIKTMTIYTLDGQVLSQSNINWQPNNSLI